MKKNLILTTALSAFLVFAFLTHVSAQTRTPKPAVENTNKPAVENTCTGSDCPPPKSSQSAGFKIPIQIKNPLSVNTIQDAIRVFMNAVVKIAIPFIVVFFIWSGLQFILAQGNPEKLKKAKAMLLNTIIGTLLVLGAWVITNAIVGTINSISG